MMQLPAGSWAVQGLHCHLCDLLLFFWRPTNTVLLVFPLLADCALVCKHE